MIRLILLAVLMMPGFLGALERLAAPSSRLLDPLWTQADPASAARVDHAAWGRFLAAYHRPGGAGGARLAYGAVTPADRAALDAYVAALEGVAVPTLSRPEQLAYWINLYNAATVRLVLDHWPLDSIRDIGCGLLGGPGPWDREVATVMGRALSLNEIEHGIIRPVWNDPRIHYAVNCAAIACPDLAPLPYEGAGIDARLDAAERAFVADPRGVRLEGGELVLSSIYLWFREDFGRTEAEVLERLRRVATGPAAEALAGRSAVDRYAYDWAINAAP